jgi:hypothetical protein
MFYAYLLGIYYFEDSFLHKGTEEGSLQKVDSVECDGEVSTLPEPFFIN